MRTCAAEVVDMRRPRRCRIRKETLGPAPRHYIRQKDICQIESDFFSIDTSQFGTFRLDNIRATG